MAEITEFCKSIENKFAEIAAVKACLSDDESLIVGGPTPNVFFPRNRKDEYFCSARSGVFAIRCSDKASFCSMFCDVGVGAGKFMFEVRLRR